MAGQAPSENGLVNVRRQPLRAIGEFMDCGECGKQFSVVSCMSVGVCHSNRTMADDQTAYTKEHPKHPQLWLDIECTYALGMDPFEKPKKPKAKPVRKEDRGKVVHYETRRGAASLSDICIKVSWPLLLLCDTVAHLSSSARTSKTWSNSGTSAALTWTKCARSSPSHANCTSVGGDCFLY